MRRYTGKMKKQNSRIKGIIMLGIFIGILTIIFSTIYNHKPQNITLIAKVADVYGKIKAEEISVDATKNLDGTYKLNLPKSINSNNVTTYYIEEGKNLNENKDGSINIELTKEDINSKELYLKTLYDETDEQTSENSQNEEENIEKNITYQEVNKNFIQVNNDSMVKVGDGTPMMDHNGGANNWYEEHRSDNSPTSNQITRIVFRDSGVPTGTIVDQFNGDVGLTGAIKGYVVYDDIYTVKGTTYTGYTLYIVGNGSGKIYASTNSAALFGRAVWNRWNGTSGSGSEYYLECVRTVEGMELLDTSLTVNMEGMFYRFWSCLAR